jgi:hypothetical protein
MISLHSVKLISLFKGKITLNKQVEILDANLVLDANRELYTHITHKHTPPCFLTLFKMVRSEITVTTYLR